MSICASAPGKAILFGEHAVVYGRPAIAIPLSGIRARAIARDTGSPLTIIAEDLGQAAVKDYAEESDLRDPLALTAALTMQYLRTQHISGEVRIRSDIPIASGLGSGAAVSAALGRAIAALNAASIPDKDLNDLVFEVEKLHHGTPSGIDNTVVAHEKPIYFIQGNAAEFMSFGAPLRIVLADTGIPALTRDAVADVRALVANAPAEAKQILDEIAALVNEARDYIERGAPQRLGELMTVNHQLLKALKVSTAELDRLVAAALSAGAYGAKLSGGGRGGNIIALVDEDSEERVKENLAQAGAKRLILTDADAGS